MTVLVMVVMVTSVAPSRWPHDCCVPVFRNVRHRGPEAKGVLCEGAGGGGSCGGGFAGGGNGGESRSSSSTIMMITLIAVCQCSETCGIGVQRRRAYCVKEPVAGHRVTVSDSACMGPRPVTSRQCSVRDCPQDISAPPVIKVSVIIISPCIYGRRRRSLV